MQFLDILGAFFCGKDRLGAVLVWKRSEDQKDLAAVENHRAWLLPPVCFLSGNGRQVCLASQVA